MLGKWRREQARKRETAEITDRVTKDIKASLENWRGDTMLLRRTMLAAAFDERIVQVEASGAVSLPDALRIETLALLNAYKEWRPTYLGEALAYFDPESIAVIDALNAQAAVRARVDEIIDEVGLELAEQLITAGREELARRERSW